MRATFRRRYDALEDTFRKSKLAQRLAVLQAAAWPIDLFEQVTAVILARRHARASSQAMTAV